MKKRPEARVRVHAVPISFVNPIMYERFAKDHTVLANPPFHFTKEALYVYPPYKVAWFVTNGVAYEWPYESAQYDFKLTQHVSVGTENYKALERIFAGMPSGSLPKAVQRLLSDERRHQYHLRSNRQAAKYAREARARFEAFKKQLAEKRATE